MTIALFIIAASAGALGRHAIHQVACTWQALLIVNVIGSGVLGVVIGSDLSQPTTTILGVGLCGAFTTYSGFALEVRELPPRWGIGYAVLTLVCACSAATLGMDLAA